MRSVFGVLLRVARLLGFHSAYSPTFFLFAAPSIVQGVGTLIDFGGTLVEYNYSRSEQEADLRAMALDWIAVGQDVAHSMQVIETESHESQPSNA